MQKYKVLIVKIPVTLKYRLDRAVLDDNTTIKEKVTKLLEDNLPTYEG